MNGKLIVETDDCFLRSDLLLLDKVIQISKLVLLIFVDWCFRLLFVLIQFQLSLLNLLEVMRAQSIGSPRTGFKTAGVSCAAESAPRVGIL